MPSLRLLIQILYGIFNPLLLGVSTDLLIQYGPEAVGRRCGGVRQSALRA